MKGRARSGLPGRQTPLEEVRAFWEEMVEHPESPWLVPALTTPGVPVPVIASAAPGYGAVWAEEVMLNKGDAGEKIVRHLIEKGALPLNLYYPPSAKTSHRFTLIQAAVAARRVSLVEWLVDQGADLPSPDCVYLACFAPVWQALPMLKALVRRGVGFQSGSAQLGFQGLLRQLEDPATDQRLVREAACLMLDSGLPPVRVAPNIPSPAFTALECGDARIFKRLIQRFPPDQLKGPFGHELLRIAVYRLKTAQALGLLRAGAPPREGCLPAPGVPLEEFDSTAQPLGGRPRITLLAEFVTGCRTRQEWREQGRSVSGEEPDLRLVEGLLEAGLRADEGPLEDPGPPTALHLAMGLGWLDLLKKLLPTAARLVACPHRYRPWAMMAADWRHPTERPAVWRLLMEAGMDPETPSSITGKSALQAALNSRDLPKATFLLEMVAPASPPLPRVRL